MINLPSVNEIFSGRIIVLIFIFLPSIVYSSTLGVSNYQSNISSVSKDGKIILVSYNNKSLNDYGIFYIKNEELKTIVDWTDSSEIEADISYDNKKVVFLSDRENNNGNNSIWISNLDGSNKEKILDNGESPLFSPSQYEIAYIFSDNVYLYNIENKKSTPIYNGSFEKSPRSLSWDGLGNNIYITICKSNFAESSNKCDIYKYNFPNESISQRTYFESEDIDLVKSKDNNFFKKNSEIIQISDSRKISNFYGENLPVLHENKVYYSELDPDYISIKNLNPNGEETIKNRISLDEINSLSNSGGGGSTSLYFLLFFSLIFIAFIFRITFDRN